MNLPRRKIRARRTPTNPDPLLTGALTRLRPGKALDLAAGSGRHAHWLAERGWKVTAVDCEIGWDIDAQPPVDCIRADLEKHEYRVAPGAWDLIVCWLYWQPDLLPEIARGLRKGGVVALAGKTSGRFATSLARYREAFPGWNEIASGEDEFRAFLIAASSIGAEEPLD